MPVVNLRALDTYANMDASTAYSHASRSKPSQLAKVGDTMTAPRHPRKLFRGRPMTVTGAVVAAYGDAMVLVTPDGYFAVKASEAVTA